MIWWPGLPGAAIRSGRSHRRRRHKARPCTVDNVPSWFAGLEFELAGATRPPQQVALNEVAVECPQHGELLLCFDALGGDNQSKATAHGNDRLHDGLGLGIVFKVADE